MLATADGGEAVRVINPLSADLGALQIGLEAHAWKLALSPDGTRATVTDYSMDSSAQIVTEVPVWDLATGEEVLRLRHEASVKDVAFSPDGRWLATASNDRQACVWSAADGEQVLCLAHEKEVGRVLFSPDGRWLATATQITSADEETVVQAWEFPSGRKGALSIKDYINDFAFSPDGARLVTAEGGRATPQSREEMYKELRLGYSGARVWDLASGQEILRIPGENNIDVASYTADGSAIILKWYGQDYLTYFDVENGLKKKTIAYSSKEQGISDFIFTDDGQYAATTYSQNRSKEIDVWHVKSGDKKATLAVDAFIGEDDALFSPDGRHLAIRQDKSVLLWDWVENRIIIEFPTTESVQVQFTPDGRRLVTAGNTLRVWAWHPQDLIADACSRLERNLTREEWRTYFGDEPYRPTCPDLPVAEQ